MQPKIIKTQKLSDVINTALTEVLCIKTRKARSLLKKKAFLMVKLEPFFVLLSEGCFVIKHTKNFPAPPPSYKLGVSLSLKRSHNLSMYDFRSHSPDLAH